MVLLLLYWILALLLGKSSDPYSMTGYFGTSIDTAVLGKNHMLHLDKVDGKVYYFDYEGIMSTIPAIVQVIFGYMIGDYIIKKGKTYEMVTGLFVAGVAFLLAGFCWDMVFPINKKIWTSSYVVYTTGLAMITIATMIFMIEFKNIKGGLARFFDVFGKNALFVFALSAFIPKGLGLIRLGEGVNPWNWIYKKVLIHTPGPKENGSLLFAICVILFMWAICWWMDKKKIYVKV
jgi:predicted acyltransferase